MLTAIQRKRNLDQSTTARAVSIWVNSHRGENTQPIEEWSFFPHPQQWRLQSEERKLSINASTANEFLRTYKSFGTTVISAFEDWLPEIVLIAQG